MSKSESQRRAYQEMENRERSTNEYRWKLAKWQKNFYCYVCGYASPGPEYLEWGGEDDDLYGPEFDWDKPIGFYYCDKCDRWHCSKDSEYHDRDKDGSCNRRSVIKQRTRPGGPYGTPHTWPPER